VITLCAVICGADDWASIARFGRAKRKWFRTFLALPHGIPSHDTFGRVFAALDPEAFKAAFLAWVATVADLLPDDVIAIDGKTLRRTFDTAADKAAIHMVSAWATAQGLCLGQVKTDAKSNEITAIPKLLEGARPHGARGHHRCHGLPDGHRPRHPRQGRRLRPESQRQPDAPA
jgi:hypothetical protein